MLDPPSPEAATVVGVCWNRRPSARPPAEPSAASDDEREVLSCDRLFSLAGTIVQGCWNQCTEMLEPRWATAEKKDATRCRRCCNRPWQMLEPVLIFATTPFVLTLLEPCLNFATTVLRFCWNMHFFCFNQVFCNLFVALDFAGCGQFVCHNRLFQSFNQV